MDDPDAVVGGLRRGICRAQLVAQPDHIRTAQRIGDRLEGHRGTVDRQVALRAINGFANSSRIFNRDRHRAKKIQPLLRRHSQSDVWDREPRGRIFQEVKRRPLYLVRETHGFAADEAKPVEPPARLSGP